MELIDSGVGSNEVISAPSEMSLMMMPAIKRTGQSIRRPTGHPALQSVRPVSQSLQRLGAPPGQKVELHERQKIVKSIPPVDISTDVTELASDNFTTVLKLLVLALVVFIVFHFWSDSIRAFMKQKIYSGKEVPWKSYLFYSVILTLILIVIAYMVIPTGQGKYNAL
jgi:hypothetical protein